MIDFMLAFAMLTLTLIVYRFAAGIYQKYKKTYLLPVFIGTISIILVLILLDIPYETYMSGGKWINELLGAAVVALAYPLYNERKTLKKLIAPIMIGTFIGAVVGISTGVLFAKWLGFEEIILYSISSKSVTTPVAVVITESLGGVTSLAVAFVMIAGISGAILHPYIFKYGRIRHYVGRGIGIGSAAHAIGTSVALENSEEEAAISSIAMIVSAILVSFISPWFISILI